MIIFKFYSAELNMHLVKCILLKGSRSFRHLTATSDLHKIPEVSDTWQRHLTYIRYQTFQTLDSDIWPTQCTRSFRHLSETSDLNKIPEVSDTWQRHLTYTRYQSFRHLTATSDLHKIPEVSDTWQRHLTYTRYTRVFRHVWCIHLQLL